MQNPLRPAAALQLLTGIAPLCGVLSLPPGLRPGAALLCFLHGHGEAQPMDPVTAMTMHGPLNPQSAIDAEGLELPFVVVAPQLPVAGDHWHVQTDRIADLVQEIESRYATDPAHRYLAGFSFGGNGVFDLAHRQPGFWAALWSVDPTRIPEADMSAPLWLSVGSRARTVLPTSVQRLRSTELAADAVDAPEGLGRVHLDQGEDHVETAQRAFADGRIYRWLLRHRREGRGSR